MTIWQINTKVVNFHRFSIFNFIPNLWNLLLTLSYEQTWWRTGWLGSASPSAARASAGTVLRLWAAVSACRSERQCAQLTSSRFASSSDLSSRVPEAWTTCFSYINRYGVIIVGFGGWYEFAFISDVFGCLRGFFFLEVFIVSRTWALMAFS